MMPFEPDRKRLHPDLTNGLDEHGELALASPCGVAAWLPERWNEEWKQTKDTKLEPEIYVNILHTVSNRIILGERFPPKIDSASAIRHL